MIFDGRCRRCLRRRRDGIWQLHMRQHHNAFLWANTARRLAPNIFGMGGGGRSFVNSSLLNPNMS